MSTTTADQNEVHIFKVGIKVVNGISSNLPVAACIVDIGQRSLLDLKFLNPGTIILLCSEKGVLSLPSNRPRTCQTMCTDYDRRSACDDFPSCRL